MNLQSNVGVFGTRTRTSILLCLVLLGESHAAELARLLGVRPYTIQNSIETLEEAGLVVGVVVGRERRVRINPRFFAEVELRNLLEKMAESDLVLLERVGQIRRRPRRSGKQI